MTKQASGCLPSWARPRPTKQRCSSSTRTSRRRRCAGNSRPPKRPSRVRTKVDGTIGCKKTGHVVTDGVARVGSLATLPGHALRGSWFGSDLAAPRHGSFTRSGCRKALLFNGGNDATTILLTSKKYSRQILLSSFASWTDSAPHSPYPPYSVTNGRSPQLCRYDELGKGCS